MDLNYLLEWFVGVTSGAGLIRLLRSRTAGRTGWIITFVLLLTLLIAGLAFFPTSAGTISGIFWAILVVGPSLLFRVVQKNMFRQQFGRARKWAIAAMCLHPADGLRQYPALLNAFELARLGRMEEAQQILLRYEAIPGWIGQSAGLYLKRLRGEWESILENCSQIPDSALGRSADRLSLYLRALGELGKLNEMVQAFAKFKKALQHLPKNLRDLTRLYVYSFAGKTDMVKTLLSGSLAQFPPDIRETWIGTAELAAGEVQEGRRRLEALRDAGDALTRVVVQQRLSRPVAVASQTLIPPSIKVLEEDQQAYSHEARFESVSQASYAPVVTYALIAANIVVFFVEVLLGGSTDARTLWRMGALMPSLVRQGEWWRMIAAQFLHYGWVHLAMNMLALYVLGPFVEREFKRIRYFLLYLLSGAGSMLTIMMLTYAGRLNNDFTVGASGSIFGLIGASAAILLYGWIREGAAVARRRLGYILLIIVLQAVFDLMTPQVSFTAHIGGAIFGFVIGVAMIITAGRRASPPL